MSVLAAVGHLSGAERVEQAIEGITSALVPAVRDLCWVDVHEPDGQMRRLFEHPGDAPAPRNASRPQLVADGLRALIPLHEFGVLGLATASKPYDADDLQFLEILAGRVALVLANARLVTDLRSTRPAWTACSTPRRGRHGPRRPRPDDLRQRRRGPAARPREHPTRSRAPSPASSPCASS